MDVESELSELAHSSVENGNAENCLEVGKGVEIPIKFGSHGADEAISGETIDVPASNFPKDAKDEWPENKQVHYLSFVKYRSYEDQKLKAQFDKADKEVERQNDAWKVIMGKLRDLRADRAEVIAQLKPLNEERKKLYEAMDVKRQEMEPLQSALNELRGSNNVGRERNYLCSSVEELNSLIKSLHYRIQHESIPLTEEKKILKEIKQLEGSRVEVVANDARKAGIQKDKGKKESIQDQVKLIGSDLDGVWKEQQVVKMRLKPLEEEKVALDNKIEALEHELQLVRDKREKAFEKIWELRTQRDQGNACFYKNRMILNKARELAVRKDIEALKELSTAEVEQFMASWNSSKAFRDDYEKRISASLDFRQLSKDGRMRNPDEKPLAPQEAPKPEPEVLVKPKAKPLKEDPIPLEKISKAKKEVKSKVDSLESSLEPSALEEKEEVAGSVKVDKNPQKTDAVDEAKLKELKREEEIEKARLALERKKKLAEKAAAKAAIKAQKEAEKKLKEREKKAKKKMQASAPVAVSEEDTEAPAEEMVEPEKTDEVASAPVPSKRKEKKEKTVASHRLRVKMPKTLSEVPGRVSRRKKTNYWMWAVPAAACFLLLVVLGYYLPTLQKMRS